MLGGQLAHEGPHVLSTGPNTTHDDVARRSIHRDGPRAVLVVVDSFFGDVVDLGVFRHKFVVEGADRRMLGDTARVAFTELLT